MGTSGLALAVGGMTPLFSWLILLISARGKRGKPAEPFENGQRRLRQQLEEMQRDRSDK
jgi:hypothetical protein